MGLACPHLRKALECCFLMIRKRVGWVKVFLFPGLSANDHVTPTVGTLKLQQSSPCLPDPWDETFDSLSSFTPRRESHHSLYGNIDLGNSHFAKQRDRVTSCRRTLRTLRFTFRMALQRLYIKRLLQILCFGPARHRPLPRRILLQRNARGGARQLRNTSSNVS